jgi:hypothetical protein
VVAYTDVVDEPAESTLVIFTSSEASNAISKCPLAEESVPTPNSVCTAPVAPLLTGINMVKASVPSNNPAAEASVQTNLWLDPAVNPAEGLSIPEPTVAESFKAGLAEASAKLNLLGDRSTMLEIPLDSVIELYLEKSKYNEGAGKDAGNISPKVG